jgi:tetratricopeptide (TPR) repeat protein
VIPVKRLMLLLALCCLTCSCAPCAEPTEAQKHYLLGEQAYNAKDLLTALVEWETVLSLKPDSAYTAKRLASLKAALPEPVQDAYPFYLAAVDLIANKDYRAADAQLGKALALEPEAACLMARLLESANAQAALRPPTTDPDTIVIHGSSPPTGPSGGKASKSVPVRVIGTNGRPIKPPDPSRRLPDLPLRLLKTCWHLVVPDPVQTAADAKRRYEALSRVGRAGAAAMTNVEMFKKPDAFIAQGEIQNTCAFRFSPVMLTIGYYEHGKKIGSEIVGTQRLSSGTIWQFQGSKRFYMDPGIKGRPPQMTTMFEIEDIEACISGAAGIGASK